MDKFLQHDGIETGYWAKRKAQFIDELGKGVKSATSQPVEVRQKPKTKKTNSKKDKPADNKDIMSKHPSELSGKDFAERMRLAKEAKAKERAGENA